MKPVPDGGHRIAVVEVMTTPRPMCLLNVYLPSIGSGSSDTEFREVLDEIHEIMQKYSVSHDIVLGGDFNALLHRKKSIKRDQVLCEFVQEQNLCMVRDYPEVPIFFHTNGDFSSQIDYLLVSQLLAAEASVVIHDMSHLNLSDHTHVSITIPTRKLSTQKEKPVAPASQKQKVNWRKCDLQEYCSVAEEGFRSVPDSVPDTRLEADLLLKSLISVLFNSSCVVSKHQPRRRKSKLGLPFWTLELKDAVQKSKLVHAEWKRAGASTGPGA